jgi:predicted O-methyltransferase YrrM
MVIADIGGAVMEQNESLNFINSLYLHLLKRRPGEQELQGWAAAARVTPLHVIFNNFVQSNEYKARNQVSTFFPPGHYHSPVVNPSQVKEYVSRQRKLRATDISGIRIDLDHMLAFFNKQSEVITSAPFTNAKRDGHRFFFDGSPFPYGDAITLNAMIEYLKPKRIVEIGSGYSTACMLDSADQFGLVNLRIVCVEPYPDRLRALLREDDFSGRVSLIELPVQDVPVDSLVDLEPNDILFIDSTHVLKTGSDVHYELFEILPRLRPGVFVHFHDIGFPFEYPDEWIFRDNYSWNETYALRAFLMFNRRFEIFFWASIFGRTFPDLVKKTNPLFAAHNGGSIWLTVMP